MTNTTVYIDLAALEENVKAAMAGLKPPTELMFVVKADAYGHGMGPVAARAHAAGVRWFVVAHVHEALALRRVAPEARILIMGAVRADDVPALLASRIMCVVVSEKHGRGISLAAAALGRRMPVHLKIDTGMGRLGVLWDQAETAYRQLLPLNGLDIQGACTHFASVEPRKAALAPSQFERFRDVVTAMEKQGGRRLFRHVSSSRAFQYYADWDLDAVRPGIILYGYGSAERDMRIRTRPILQWQTRVIQVKKVPAAYPIGYYGTYVTSAPTTIATLSAGYADGYHRALGNKGVVLIRGQRCNVVGRISMNWITVDCGPDAVVEEGDEAVLLGEQAGSAIWGDELARMVRTIPYEILTSINSQAERIYNG